MNSTKGMKRFLLFGGYPYYPNGGFNDFIGSFDSLDLALAEWDDGEEDHESDWGHVVDAETGQVIWESEEKPHDYRYSRRFRDETEG